MTSTSVTKIGGVVIVTQVIPQEETSIPLESAATAMQAPPHGTQAPFPATVATLPVKKAPPTPETKMDKMTATFMRGQPQGLGVVQIMIGVLCILFSLTAAFHPILLVHAPLCLAVSFVISGSLALAAARRTSGSLIFSTLVWNVISTVIALVGVACLCWLLAYRPPAERLCDSESWGDTVPTEAERLSCINKMWLLNASLYGPLGLLLVLLVLQVCVTITVCVFSGAAIRHCDSPPMVPVDDDNAALFDAHDSDDSLLESN